MVLSRVRLIRVRLVLVNLNPINDTYRSTLSKRSNAGSRINFFDHFPRLAFLNVS